MIQSLPGRSDDEKIDSAEPPIRRLLKAVQLVDSRLKLNSLISNPESARYGKPRPLPVYRSFDRMVRLFKDIGHAHHVKITMSGRSLNRPLLYDSFETLPLVLIDNAIKYAQRRGEVHVIVWDDAKLTDGCYVAVESEGKLIDLADRSSIFERGFRSSEAQKITSSGGGLGLFIAQIVAHAHNFELRYTARPISKGGLWGTNIFEFDVRSVSE